MWIVELALRRPYTIAVGVIVLFLAGYLSIKSMLVDVLPTIDIPVVGVLWSYNGLSAIDMERRVLLLSERAFSTSVNGIIKMESQAIPGVGVMRIFFEDGTNIGSAIAQISASAQSALKMMPPGMAPPVILQSNASSVPVSQLTMFSDTLPEERIMDYALNFLRVQLFTIPGLSLPAPYGGRSRLISIDVNPQMLQAKNLSAIDVSDALQASNIILPTGTARIGNYEYSILLNASPEQVSGFEKIPVKVINGAPLTLGDVAKVSDSSADQTNIVRVNGKRASFLYVMKKAGASTLDVINAVKKKIPDLRALAPAGFNMRLDFDQSVYVNAAIINVLREACISGMLVALMILLFLGSWRSVIIVCTSIPAAICAAIVGLKLTGHTINIMTLGGLSLAIGMLVDDATVEVENIHRNRNMGKPITVAILDGASQIALPAIMATLAICVVFFPVVLLTGPSRFLFIPLALAVVIAMLASYLLSRTLVPLLSRMLLPNEEVHEHGGGMFPKFDAAFDRLKHVYGDFLSGLLAHRAFVMWSAAALLAVTLTTPFVIGTDFFPAADTGQMKLHFRAMPGTRLEETEKQVDQVERIIRKIVPADELLTINSMIGLPPFYNLGFVPTDNVGSMDAEISVALNEKHQPTDAYKKKIRKAVSEALPAAHAYFQPADIVNQVLNFGLSAPIDIQFDYPNIDKSYGFAQRLMRQMHLIPGVQDIAMKQVFNYPTLRFNVDRVKAAQVGVIQRDIASSMLISLSSSFMLGPSFYLNPENNVNYSVVVKTPIAEMTRVEDVLATPVSPSHGILTSNLNATFINSPNPNLLPGNPMERLGNLAEMESLQTMGAISHASIQRVVNVTASNEGRDLGAVISDIQKKIADLGQLPEGMKITIQGQGAVMREAFGQLGLGLIVSILLVYLLMVVLFQSWLDPFIVMVAVPGALCGILWCLLLTGTTINVESFMGAIMAVGIAASNSILLVSFANEIRLEKGLSPIEAALEAGKTRLRPVLMTALAMIIGMAPAALALGEGGEQNAPLGRAVIGGLLVATLVTLLIVPIVYSLLRTELPTKHLLDERFQAEKEKRSLL